ncbi:MAG TPA: 2-octaprenyl-6-methoxyphenyl hydroxylase [Gammaproteobacteria bacterium]|nr:2-octaprenyl-6-methoxyphenyl hydroxylase [Gammaproteobacteria bacterium]
MTANPDNRRDTFDVLIVGGGMAGASLACALGGQPLRVALVEAVAFGDAGPPSYDDRTTALSHATRMIFEGIGVWPALAPSAEPIRSIHVTDRGHVGTAHLRAAELGLPAFGYVVPNRALGSVLIETVRQLDNVELVNPATVQGITRDEDTVTVSVREGRATRRLRARLLVGADGTESPLRDMLGIGAVRRAYGESAVVANVTPVRPHGGTARERFTADGPMALLPAAGDRYAVIWTARSERVDELMSLDDATFLRALEARFGGRVGPFREAGRRHVYPLAQVVARQLVADRVALVGNAAHTLHPVAGQGFNLGLRDVALIAELVVRAARAGEPPGSGTLLQRYAAARRRDLWRTSGLTEGLLRTFSSRVAAVVAGRNLGMIGLDLAGPLRHAFTRGAMGVSADMPWLARGRPLSTLPAGAA